MDAIPTVKEVYARRMQETFGTATAAGFDFDAARREGWTLAEAEPNTDGIPGVQLQRFDTHDGTEPRFPGDQQAWIYVVVRARAGSERHQQALTLLDPCERCLIEATCGPV